MFDLLCDLMLFLVDELLDGLVGYLLFLCLESSIMLLFKWSGKNYSTIMVIFFVLLLSSSLYFSALFVPCLSISCETYSVGLANAEPKSSNRVDGTGILCFNGGIC